MKRLAILAALFALIVPTSAMAGNWADGRLDTISSQLAGHGVNTYCEDSWVEWYNGFGANQGILGFTSYLGTTVYLNPRECATLHGWLLNGNSEDLGAYWFSLAILVMVHESIHQRLYPVNLSQARNEAYVECLALKEFSTDAVRFFGIPTTVSQLSVKPVIQRVKIGKNKFRKVTTYKPVTIQVANPYLARVEGYARGWDNTMPSSYHGATC